ncbi:hypothetical protein JOL62DRAFT_612356 [Phyllosticta paracitricarpa]|uniref:Uncharacterized protein n=1 Tax=Phyllosticta paracitricarpa TaxID=2016321 RepID=A0ABR1N5U0_9PEZI
MLRYRATEIRLTAQDIEDGSKRLAARRAAGNTRSAPCKIAPPENPGPRLRRGPERSRDESIVHPGALHGPQACTLEHSQAEDSKANTKVSAKPERAQRTISPNDGSSEDDSICTSDLERLSTHPTRSRRLTKRTANQAPSLEKAGPGASTLGRSLPQYDGSLDLHRTPVSSAQLGARHFLNTKPSGGFEQQHEPCRPAPKHGDSSTSRKSRADESRTRTTKEQATTSQAESAHASPPKSSTETRDSVAQRDLDLSAPDHAASGSGDPIPIIRLPSNSSTLHSSDSERRRHSLPAVANVSPFGTLSRSPSIACAPCSMSRVSPRASQDTRRPLFELRMPTFESPERMSPPPRRVPRHRHSPSPRRPMPTFAEIPHSNFSSLDVLPSFSFDSSPPQPSGGFIERYPTAAGSRTLRTLSPHLTTASMPSLQPPPERHSRRRASGNAHVQVARVHAHGRTIQQSWSPAVDSAASTAMAVATAAAHAAAAATESRRNTMDIQHRRPQRLRSVSARLLPPWQDEQENSGRAERQAMMAEIEARRRYVEQTNDGRIDRTPPSLGTFERRVFQQ